MSDRQPASLPHGWRYEPSAAHTCERCQGTGRVWTLPTAIAPSGVRVFVTGSDPLASARSVAELHAPDRLEPKSRQRYYGIEPSEPSDGS